MLSEEKARARQEYRRQARERFDREYGEAPSSGEPSDTFGIEGRARREWESNAAIRAEFGEFERYIAFIKADAKGLVKIFCRK